MSYSELQPAPGWLASADRVRAEEMRDFVSKLFAEDMAGTKTYTPHGPDHFQRVECKITELIPPTLHSHLTDTERKLLSWSAWTHDIGMNRAVYADAGTVDDHELRRQHVEKSAEWVLEHQAQLNLDPVEAQVLAEFITFHSRKNDLRHCPEHRHCCGGYVRPRLMAAYLRLGDALDVAFGRVEAFEYDRFSFLLESVDPAIKETIFHWVKSFVVSGIVVNHHKGRIEVEFQWPRDNDIDPSSFELLARYVTEELNSELESVEATLVDGGISSLHSVHRMDDVSFTPPPRSAWTKEVMSVLDYLRIVYSPNSTEMIAAALEAIRDVAEAETKPLQVALQQLHEGLESQLSTRRCHNALYHVLSFVKSALRSVTTDKSPSITESAVREKLANFARNYEQLVDRDSASVHDQSHHFWTSLAEIGESRSANKMSQNRYDFVLFGCSESVVATLRDAPPEVESLGLWIAEGRTKSRHGPYNAQTYVDAERYAQMIRSQVSSKGPRISINVIPDASIATFLSCAELEGSEFKTPKGRDEMYLPFIDAVVFGSNGIYLEPEVSVAHTSGHLGAAIVAKEYGVPVLVVASGLKIKEHSPTEWQTSFRDKDGRWLTSDHELRRRLFGPQQKGRNLAVVNVKAWNLREDQVPLRYITGLVSEIGYCVVRDPDSDMGDVMKELREWMCKVKSMLPVFNAEGNANGTEEDVHVDSKPTDLETEVVDSEPDGADMNTKPRSRRKRKGVGS